MPEVLQSVLGFVVAIAVLVAFHEYGHFWVARRLGVRVLRFSVGFGRPLWSRVGADGTEYRISAIPLGGYVKMLDEREGPVDEAEGAQAFNRQGVWTRIAIVSAGPLANFLLAIVLYTAVYALGQRALLPILGEITTDSPAAQAGLQAGQTVFRIAEREVRSWDELRTSLLDQALGQETITIHAGSAGGPALPYTLRLDGVTQEPLQFFQQLGMNPPRVPLEPVLSAIQPDSAALRAGLADGDRVTAIDGEVIEEWADLVRVVRARPGATVELDFIRDQRPMVVTVTLESIPAEQGAYGRLGAAVAAQPELWQHLTFDYRLGLVDSLLAGTRQTLDISWLTLKLLGRMIVGDVSVRNISGPLSIAEYAGYSAAAGLVTFLSFLALISVSLGVLNLLPVPVLDGGHLLYYFVEVIKGSPLSERAQQLGQSVGLALLFCLMSLALYNDLYRLLG